MIPVVLNKKSSSLRIPETYSELTRKQFIKLADLLHRKLLIDDLQPLVLSIILQAKNKFVKNRFLSLKSTPDLIFQMLPGTEGILSQQVTEDVLKYISIPAGFLKKNKKYYSPSSDLLSFRFREFVDAEKYYIDYCNSKGEDLGALHNLLAVIFRPGQKNVNVKSPDFRGDFREKYNDFLVPSRSKEIAKATFGEKMAGLMFYTGCREKLISNHPSVFKAPEEDEKPKGINFGLTGMLLNLSGGKFGDMTKTEDEFIHTILLDTEKTQLERIEQENNN